MKTYDVTKLVRDKLVPLARLKRYMVTYRNPEVPYRMEERYLAEDAEQAEIRLHDEHPHAMIISVRELETEGDTYV